MKRVHLVLSAVAALSLVLAACGTPAGQPCGEITPETGGALPDLQGCELRIAVENAYQPFNFIDETTGEAMGYDYDLFNEACERLNCQPVFVETSWDTIVAVMGGQAEADTFDVAADGITITPERAQFVDFSQPYIKLRQVLLVRADETRFNNIVNCCWVRKPPPPITTCRSSRWARRAWWSSTTTACSFRPLSRATSTAR
jgi:polar amino acid transport system substrate-binding protein